MVISSYTIYIWLYHYYRKNGDWCWWSEEKNWDIFDRIRKLKLCELNRYLLKCANENEFESYLFLIDCNRSIRLDSWERALILTSVVYGGTGARRGTLDWSAEQWKTKTRAVVGNLNFFRHRRCFHARLFFATSFIYLLLFIVRFFRFHGRAHYVATPQYFTDWLREFSDHPLYIICTYTTYLIYI